MAVEMPEGLTLDPVNRQSTASVIAGLLRRAIMEGSLPPGTQMGEAALAAQLNVSRGPLREAMQRLVQEGLLRSELHRGLFVIELGPDDVEDIYVARSAVEAAAARLILRRDPKATADRLAEVHEEMIDAAGRRDRRALSDADLRFHELFVTESGSPRLRRMSGTLLVETRLCMTALERKYQAPAELADEHGAIIAAIRSGDEDKLLNLIDGHMSDAVDRLETGPDHDD